MSWCLEFLQAADTVQKDSWQLCLRLSGVFWDRAQSSLVSGLWDHLGCFEDFEPCKVYPNLDTRCGQNLGPRLILNLYFDSSVALWQNVHLGSRSIECQKRIERSIQKVVFVSQKSSQDFGSTGLPPSHKLMLLWFFVGLVRKVQRCTIESWWAEL